MNEQQLRALVLDVFTFDKQLAESVTKSDLQTIEDLFVIFADDDNLLEGELTPHTKSMQKRVIEMAAAERRADEKEIA